MGSEGRESLYTIAVIFIVVFFLPSIFLSPGIVFGYGGGGGGAPTIFIPSTPIAQDVLSSTKKITSFTITGQVGETIIDHEQNTIRLTLPHGSVVSSLVPKIRYSGESMTPSGNVPRDFSIPRQYSVVAEDASVRSYTVYVNFAPKRVVEDPNSEWFEKDVQRTDMVRDGEIDIYDFNTLIVHWNDSGQADNPADVNKDNRVDVFDFNLLMIHWGKIEF